MYGLLGPNGAGKTTIIRMIMNIIVPDSGVVSLFGGARNGRRLPIELAICRRNEDCLGR